MSDISSPSVILLGKSQVLRLHCPNNPVVKGWGTGLVIHTRTVTSSLPVLRPGVTELPDTALCGFPKRLTSRTR